jgi:hypothetical protein
MRQRIIASDHEHPEDLVENLPEGWLYAPCFILYGNHITDETGRLNVESVRDWYHSLPYASLACLDLETIGEVNWMDMAQNGEGWAVRLYRAALELKRVERPDLRASFYAVGTQTYTLSSIDGSGNQYWDRAHDEQKIAARFGWMRQRAIGDLMDWWGPTCYDKYSGVQPHEPAWTRASVGTCKLENDGKLILPFTWSQRNAVQLTTSEWLTCQVDPALETGANGVVLWEAWNKTNDVPNRRERVREFVAALPPQVDDEAPPA